MTAGDVAGSASTAGTPGGPGGAGVIDRAGLQALFTHLLEEGYRLVGPTVCDGAVVLDEVDSVGDLPQGWGDEQEAGQYRLRRRDDEALFGYVVGPQSLKRFLFPPRSTLWRARPDEADGFEVVAERRVPPRYAFVGARPCDLAALAVQDRVFLGGDHPDPLYGVNRDGIVLVVVNCGEPAATCFCASMGTGPRADAGAGAQFDLALTELSDRSEEGGAELVVEVGSRRGELLLEAIPHRRATELDLQAAREVTARAEASMRRALPVAPHDARSLLAGTLEHPRWDDVAARCLSCTNCTLVCPTCFCSAVEDTTDLAGEAAREQRWDSCFSLSHSYLHGGSVRASVRARYRQWLTHKLGTWWDQFGMSGCVGCGRCIAWCPAAIDLTAEIAALAEQPAKASTTSTAPAGARSPS